MNRSKHFSFVTAASICALGAVAVMGTGCGDGTSASDLLGSESATAASADSDLSSGGDAGFGPRGSHGSRVDLQEELGLTDEQAEAVKTARESYREESKSVHEALKAEEISLEEAISQITELATAHDATVQSILTADQWSQWQVLKAERLQERIDRINEYSAEMVERQLERLTEALGLSDDQIASIQTILQAGVASELKTLQQVQSGEIHSAVARLVSRADRAASREAIAATLTAEQQETFGELADRRRGGRRGGGRGGHHGGGRGPA